MVSGMRGSEMEASGTSARMAHTVKQAAALMSLSVSKVEKLVASGELPSIKVGRSRRIRTAAIEEFLSERSESAA
jgi:excisionase family DNA binding protein